MDLLKVLCELGGCAATSNPAQYSSGRLWTAAAATIPP